MIADLAALDRSRPSEVPAPAAPPKISMRRNAGLGSASVVLARPARPAGESRERTRCTPDRHSGRSCPRHRPRIRCHLLGAGRPGRERPRQPDPRMVRPPLRHRGPYRDAGQLYEFEDGRRLVLPLVRRRHRPPRLDTEESWPAEWGIGGPVPAGRVSPAEARAVFDDLTRRPAFQMSVRFRPGTTPCARAPRLRASGQSRTGHRCWTSTVDSGPSGSAASTSARRAVRRVEGSEVEVEVDRTGRPVPAFHATYEQSMVRWAAQQNEPLALALRRRTRALPARQLEAVAARLVASCAIWMTWLCRGPRQRSSYCATGFTPSCGVGP
jgi:hypothetical protein